MFVVNGAVIGTWVAAIPGTKAALGASGADFGLTFTGGLRVELQSNWGLLAEAYYNTVTIATKAVRDGEIVDDEIDLDGFGVNLGIGYSW